MLAGTLAKEIDDDSAQAAKQIREHDEATFRRGPAQRSIAGAGVRPTLPGGRRSDA